MSHSDEDIQRTLDPIITRRHTVAGFDITLPNGQRWSLASATNVLTPYVDDAGKVQVKTHFGYARKQTQDAIEALRTHMRERPAEVPAESILSTAAALLSHAHAVSLQEAYSLLACEDHNLINVLKAVASAGTGEKDKPYPFGVPA